MRDLYILVIVGAFGCAGGTLSSPERGGVSSVHPQDVEPARFAVITEDARGAGMTVSVRGSVVGQLGGHVVIDLVPLDSRTWDANVALPLRVLSNATFSLSLSSDAWSCTATYCDDTFVLSMVNESGQQRSVSWWVAAHIEVEDDASLETGRVTVFPY